MQEVSETGDDSIFEGGGGSGAESDGKHLLPGLGIGAGCELSSRSR